MGGRPKRSHWECNDSVLRALVLESLPDEHKLTEFHAMRKFLNEQVKDVYPYARIEAYGSVASNLPMRHSDVDLCIVFDDVEETKCSKQWRVKVLKALRGIIRRANVVKKGFIEVRAHARVPVVCFTHQPSGLSVDINTMDQGIFKAAFMRTVANLSPLLVPLVRVVKLWAHKSNLNDPTDGTLNSYCLTLLSIFHLQQLVVPHLPPIWQLLPLPESRSKQPPDVNGTSSKSDSVGLQRPLSTQRIMHKGVRPPPDTAEKIQGIASEWRKANAPPTKQVPLETVALAFFVRLSSFLLARYRRFDDSCWRTVSTWSGTLFPCNIQKLQLAKVKGNMTKCMGKNGVSDDAQQDVLLRELLRTLQKHWGKSGGCMSDLRAATRRVLDLAPLLVSTDAVASLRAEFEGSSENYTAHGAPESGSGVSGSPSKHNSKAATSDSDWRGCSAATRKRMLDAVQNFLLRVPRSTRSNEQAAHEQTAVDMDASSESSDPAGPADAYDAVSGQGSCLPNDTAASVDTQQAHAAAESALRTMGQLPESTQPPQQLNHALEAKEDDLILNMSGEEDDNVGNDPAAGVPAAEGGGGQQSCHSGEGANSASPATAAAHPGRTSTGTGMFIGEHHAAEVNSPEERLRVLCNKRLSALHCMLGVEDPFDENDNAARTLRHFHRLISHALLPVVYGTEALAFCLRAPPVRDVKRAQNAEDEMRCAYNVMQRFEHPIQKDSDEQCKVDTLAKKWLQHSSGPTAEASRQLQQAHHDALQRCNKPLPSDAGVCGNATGSHVPTVHAHGVSGVRGHAHGDQQSRNGNAADSGDQGHAAAATGIRQEPQLSLKDPDIFPALSEGQRVVPQRPNSGRPYPPSRPLRQALAEGGRAGRHARGGSRRPAQAAPPPQHAQDAAEPQPTPPSQQPASSTARKGTKVVVGDLSHVPPRQASSLQQYTHETPDRPASSGHSSLDFGAAKEAAISAVRDAGVDEATLRPTQFASCTKRVEEHNSRWQAQRAEVPAGSKSDPTGKHNQGTGAGRSGNKAAWANG